jgi:hypothetical protein
MTSTFIFPSDAWKSPLLATGNFLRYSLNHLVQQDFDWFMKSQYGFDYFCILIQFDDGQMRKLPFTRVTEKKSFTLPRSILPSAYQEVSFLKTFV